MSRPAPDERPRYLVELEALPDDLAPAAVRLRRLLKVALRAFRLRCVRAEEAPGPTPAAEEEQ